MNENWFKIISFAIIGAFIATFLKIPILLFFNETLTYIVGFLIITLFLYLGFSREAKNILHKKQVIVVIIIADITIRTLAVTILLPDIFPTVPLYEIRQNLPNTFRFFLMTPLVLAGIILPYYFSYRICTEKNRNPLKGAVLTFIFWWIAPLALWLGLKVRDPQTGQLR